ncbi:MAG: efflux RND transporter permease subunit, partial [Phycisphaerales bacterium]|nr:efflux RND transporter permease subunit [Phycisphaerales bacterium]
SRENGKRRVVVQANVRGRDVAGVVADAQEVIERDVRLPAGQYLDWGGQFENLQSASERLMLVVPACFALIILLLYGALGSVRDAAIVFTGVPLALIGGVLSLFLRGMPFSISAAVGFIALSGIVVNDSLIYMEFFNSRRRAGATVRDAAYEAGRARLRAILLTTVTTVLGLTPLMLEQSFQARFLIPMAITISFGLIAATAVTLVVLPSLLLIGDDLRRLWRIAWSGRLPSEEEHTLVREFPAPAGASSGD